MLMQETISQWRTHYLGAFLFFAVYFKSLPADVGAKSTKHLMSLRAVRCRKFAITHSFAWRPKALSPASHGSGGFERCM